MNPASTRLPRREFLATAAAIACPYVIPSGVLGWQGQPGANERLTLGHIGVGGMGGTHLQLSLDFRKAGFVNIGAICEADSKRLESAVQRVGAGCRGFRDYRELLQCPDIDAVIIATPDHLHALQTVHACQAGKHVYVEKPASCTVAEGQAMVRAAAEHQRVVQVGSQARSAEPAHQVSSKPRATRVRRVCGTARRK